jgi:hypothetical protein
MLAAHLPAFRIVQPISPIREIEERTKAHVLGKNLQIVRPGDVLAIAEPLIYLLCDTERRLS